jgi:hypothetical protein
LEDPVIDNIENFGLVDCAIFHQLVGSIHFHAMDYGLPRVFLALGTHPVFQPDCYHADRIIQHLLRTLLYELRRQLQLISVNVHQNEREPKKSIKEEEEEGSLHHHHNQ